MPPFQAREWLCFRAVHCSPPPGIFAHTVVLRRRLWFIVACECSCCVSLVLTQTSATLQAASTLPPALVAHALFACSFGAFVLCCVLRVVVCSLSHTHTLSLSLCLSLCLCLSPSPYAFAHTSLAPLQSHSTRACICSRQLLTDMVRVLSGWTRTTTRRWTLRVHSPTMSVRPSSRLHSRAWCVGLRSGTAVVRARAHVCVCERECVQMHVCVHACLCGCSLVARACVVCCTTA